MDCEIDDVLVHTALGDNVQAIGGDEIPDVATHGVNTLDCLGR